MREDGLFSEGHVDNSGSGGSSVPIYANVAAFPASAITGSLAVDASTGNLYEYNGASWIQIGGPGSALTLGNNDAQTANLKGAALISGVLSMQSATASFPGLVNITTQSFAGNKTFIGTIAASNLTGTNTGDQTISLTGDITGSGTGSFATTLATVNANVGSFGSATAVATFTVNAKGLITGAGSSSIQIAESQVTNLVTDLAGKQATGNYVTALTGDGTASGPGSVALTLATVNANVGSFGSSTAIPTFTVNAKGLVTAAGTAAVIAPAGTLSGTTLNATVVTSSLTSVGTIATGTWAGTTVAILHGGTGVTAVTTVPAATAFAGWDANKNLSSNNNLPGFLSTATAAGTSTLVIGSAYEQFFTGSTTQTVVLPVVSTLSNGFSFLITNLSSGVVTVQTSGSNILQAMAANTQMQVTCINTAGGTGTASWSFQYITLNGSATSVSGTNVVTNSNLSQMGANTIKGNNTGSTANAADLTVDNVLTMLGLLSIKPQGRLTLTTGVPVMIADATAQTSVFYVPYVGLICPIYDGTNLVYSSIGSSGLTMTLNTTNQVSGSVYDLFVFLNSGVVTIGAGPAWTSTTARGTGAGTTQISQINGIWSNTVAIVLKNGVTTFGSVSANQATYVGSVYMTANGQTGVTMKPAAAGGGGGNIIGVYNAYNRVRATSISRDSSAGYTYASSVWRAMDANNNNRITWVDGLQQTPTVARLQQEVQNGTATDVTFIGCSLDSTSTTPGVAGITQAAAIGNAQMPTSVESFLPQLGLHFIQAQESVNSGTATFSNSAGNIQALAVDLEF